MSIYLEALILYIILFFSGSAAGRTLQAAILFSISSQILEILLFFIPSIAVIWYILARNWKTERRVIKPGKKDLIVCLISFPILLIIGAIMGIISTFTVPAAQTMPFSPSDISGWIFLSFSCICLAYLEESFFRFFLLSKRNEMGMNAAAALLVSTALFSLCHIYLGPFGFLNSVIAGLILGFIFLKSGSLHGIAITHGLYNITAYVINALK
ncbi:MAG: CPBP family intramembrane metalloprotease [Treponema sp.]|nr:CPBP family intramembrane metalloprotease [Treponema sp.]